MPRSHTLRTPVFGVVLVDRPAKIEWEKPLDLKREIPVALTRTPGAVIVEDVTERGCTVRNTAGRPVAYVVVVVLKKIAAALLAAPWRDVVKFLLSWAKTKEGRVVIFNKLLGLLFDRANPM